MTVRPGAKIRIPCEVKPGPFPDERMVRVHRPGGPWLGFVETFHLCDAPEVGPTDILATVTEVSDEEFVARLPGHASAVPGSAVPPYGCAPLVLSKPDLVPRIESGSIRFDPAVDPADLAGILADLGGDMAHA